jgi:uncharacterized protein YqgQ
MKERLGGVALLRGERKYVTEFMNQSIKEIYEPVFFSRGE